MKQNLIFIFTVLFCYNTIAQNPIFRPIARKAMEMTVVDSGYVRVWYAFNALDIHKPETYDDMQRLEIGSGISKYFSHFVYTCDSLIVDFRKKNKNASGIPRWMGDRGKEYGWSEYFYSEYFKDFGKNTLTEYARMPHGGIPNFQYTEAMPVQIWEMQQDTLTIAGFLCQKATCRFRGRSYTAWFAHDIPISNGPWKFGGLPGLILKVYDEGKEYLFECVRIENFRQKYPIKIHDDYRNYRKTERKEVLKLQKAIHDDYNKVAGIISETPRPRNEISYRPLELE
ncbi:MAG: GLPGLI family protein [Fermentimonas sp.]|jgi:GLPGLI family protein|nr:GLPGLI family protein [Fermentimonas sp.]